MKGIEKYNLRKLCSRHEIDPYEVDSSLTYRENRSSLTERFNLEGREAKFEREYERWLAEHPHREYRDSITCPRCGSTGSGLHLKWVLNEQKRRYYPYYYVAHSIRSDRGYRVQWHYVRLAQAIEIQKIRQTEGSTH